MNLADDLKRLVALRAQKDEHEAAVKAINAEIEDITARVLDRWAEDGVSSVKVDGATVSLRRQVWARIVDRARVAAALEAAGLDIFLIPNTNQLSAFIREREEAGEPLPPALVGVVEPFERFSLSVRTGR